MAQGLPPPASGARDGETLSFVYLTRQASKVCCKKGSSSLGATGMDRMATCTGGWRPSPGREWAEQEPSLHSGCGNSTVFRTSFSPPIDLRPVGWHDGWPLGQHATTGLLG